MIHIAQKYIKVAMYGAAICGAVLFGFMASHEKKQALGDNDTNSINLLGTTAHADVPWYAYDGGGYPQQIWYGDGGGDGDGDDDGGGF